MAWGGASHDVLNPQLERLIAETAGPSTLTPGTERAAGHPSWASGAPAQKVSPLLACPGSQLVLEGAQPAARCSHTSVPWAHVVPCPPGSLQRIHPGALPAASALPGQPVTEPGVGWTLPSSPGVSASPPHALRTALSLGKLGPLGVVAVAVGGSHPQMSPVGPWCKLQSTADAREGVCAPEPTRWRGPCMGHVWLSPGASGRRPSGTEFRLRTWPELGEEAARGVLVVPKLPPPGSSRPRCSVLRYVQGAGAFHPHPRPSAGCLLLGTNIDQPVWKGSFLAGTPGGCQLGAGGKGLWVGWETQAAAAVH